MNPVRHDAKYVMTQASHVRLNESTINQLTEEWLREKITIPVWPQELHFTDNPDQLLDYLIALDTLNFCFWTPDKKQSGGYTAFARNLAQWWANNPDKANWTYLSNMPIKEMKKITDIGRPLQLIKLRLKLIQEVSQAIMEKYSGKSRELIIAAQGQINHLVEHIVRDLPSFNDEAMYRGKEIVFHKRAQILAADIWGAFAGKGYGALTNLEYLTAFADYRLPQMLHHWGVLEYSSELSNRIRHDQEIAAGSEEEVELRAATIQAIEELQLTLAKHERLLLPLEIDWIIWNKSQSEKNLMSHHLTITTNY